VLVVETTAPSGRVTFLFTDMESSTPAWERHEAAMKWAQERHDAILRRAIGEANGYVFSTAGDGIGAAFSSAEAALTTAIALQRALAAERWPDPVAIRVRMGMNTGEAFEQDENYFGPAVIRAARLMSLVDGGRIVCSRATQEALGGHLPEGVHLLPVGLVHLKGLSAPENVFAVSAPGLRESGQTVTSPSPLPWSVPYGLTRLVGREMEVEEVSNQLRERRLVTITGTGGVGKSRLAAAVAAVMRERFPDGTAWVELAPLAQGADVVQAVADVLQVHPQPGASLIDTLTAALDGRRTLIILDSCEHVRTAAADVARSIVARCRDATILTSSRERLGVDGERVITLAPLDTIGDDCPALELLRDRMDTAADSDVHGLVLREIVERLDGLPLALELAAARCRSLGPEDVAARLRDQYGVLADRTRQVERHRTLEQVLGWSYRLLDDHERMVLERTSVFAGSFTLTGVEQLFSDHLVPSTVDDALASLVDKSLVRHEDARRFRLLETTRQFAAGRLDHSGQRQAAENSHSRFIADEVRRIHDGLHGPDEATWVEALDALWPDVRTAIRRAIDGDDLDTAVDLVIHLAYEAFWRRPEAFAWIEAAVDRFGDQPGPHQHELLGAGSLVAWTLLDLPKAIALAERALAADPAPGSALDCLPEAGAVGAYNFSGQFDKAAATCRKALELLPATGDRWTEAGMWSSLALSIGIASPQSDDARQTSAIARESATQTGNPTIIGYAYFAQAMSHLVRDGVAAASFCQSALGFADQVHNQWLVGVTAATAASAIETGRASATDLDRLLAAADELHRTGWFVHAWSAAWGAVPILYELGDHDDAALLAGACQASGVANLGSNALPDQIIELQRGTGDARQLQLFSSGSTHSLPQVLRMVAHERQTEQC
jgi:predicted ATPase/class 3 adenylate cyclase